MGGAGKHEADGRSRWSAQPPTEQRPAQQPAMEQAPFWIPRERDERPAWDEPGWFRDQPEPPWVRDQPEPDQLRDQPQFTGGGPPRSRRKLALVGGIGAAAVVALVAALFLTGVVGSGKAIVPGFHPTATKPALAAKQTAEAFLAAWQKGEIGKAARYTNHPAAAAAALNSYRNSLHLRALRLRAQSATAGGTVAFSVAATVGLAGSTAVTAAWSYSSHLTAYDKHGGWWVRWNPELVAPNLTAGESVVSVPVAPGAAEVADDAGNNLQDSGDPGLDNIAAALRAAAPAGQGTPGVEVELVRGNTPLTSTADLLSHPVATGVVKTTIDPRVEAAAESAVQAHPDSSMVVIQPSTGDILAVANNDGANDFALTARVAPGSTNKIITSTALFTTGLVGSPSQPVECPAQLDINGNVFTNDQGESEPPSTPFLTDFAASCNNAFARWYSNIGPQTLAETAEKYYGLNQQWNIGIGAGGPYYAIPASAYNGELAQELFGQGALAASPLAMASVGATVDTGSFKQPIVVPGQSQLSATPLPAGVHQDLWQMMRAVTQSGGTAAGVFDGVGSAVYGKTGTADVSGQGQPNSWMVAFDPTLNVAVGCLVLNAGYGASFAGPEAADLLQLLAQSGG
jgi:Penicillin binding protein transpeptidase domain/NTF2-like N-terminal transpeptidase domain